MLNREIINWYEFNKRDLPWRNTTDPYKIWISEIMLQQTQVVTVIDYYHRFMNRFPTLSLLAEAEEHEVLNLWQGLGYYSRARHIHHTAKCIVAEYKGVFPDSYKEILKLKGIGVYTASAIAAFAYNLPHAAVDGNVYRVLSRLFGLFELTTTPGGKKLFQSLADEILADAPANVYNQAIIEFGALQCTTKNPECDHCPLREQCFAYNNKQQAALPVKKKKIKLTDRYLYYLFIYSNDHFLIQQRGETDIWRKLFQYPLIETKERVELDELIKSETWRNLLKDKKVRVTNQVSTKVHKLSHQNLHIEFIHIELKAEELDKFAPFIAIDRTAALDYPMPKPIEKHLDMC